MAKSVTVQVDGLRELGERLKTLNLDMVNRIARAATAAGAVVIRDAAKANAPVKTGALKKGIVVKRLPKAESLGLTSEHIVTVSTREMKKYTNKSRAAVVELQGPIAPVTSGGKTYRAKKLLGRKENYVSSGDFFYANFIEFGTVKMAAQPFLRPAYDLNKERAVAAIKDRIETRLKKANA
ncbi:HK97-gp10 family putative phage morphogenesis protein [Variovorax sp. PAMC 28711]|uniref:HK97-gp10 family putative phage morphogenesis protein n=1 Tax=Variovorax sp. PAMC 28711 TaxID=1795631 RepID=UPI00078DF4F9|nr:HK97-gp10 family putative phage morphogenesis protein [Variovorax sp. PAMC 28711]AMM23167.1 hypothetical protein AX767_01350 [Variovorax sp. PAMC 28711]